MNGGAKCIKGAVWSAWLATLKVIGSVTIRYSACDFLFNFNRNYAAIGQVFSTYDRDNDQAGNCASYFGGGFWYKRCFWCGVNTSRSAEYFHWAGLPGGKQLQKSRMWLQCK